MNCPRCKSENSLTWIYEIQDKDGMYMPGGGYWKCIICSHFEYPEFPKELHSTAHWTKWDHVRIGRGR
mgnify:CR=1 FL=1